MIAFFNKKLAALTIKPLTIDGHDVRPLLSHKNKHGARK